MQRMTRQRQSVFNELRRDKGFRSAQRIYDDLTNQGQRVGLATVYRNLQALAEMNVVDVLRMDDGESMFRLCEDEGHHHHLVCRNCGHTEEIEVSEAESWISQIASQHGFTEVAHSLEVFGLCSECSAVEDDED